MLYDDNYYFSESAEHIAFHRRHTLLARSVFGLAPPTTIIGALVGF